MAIFSLPPLTETFNNDLPYPMQDLLRRLQQGFGGNASGTLPSRLILGTTAGDNAAIGIVGEYITGTGSTATTDGNIHNVCSMSLTAGDWDVGGWMAVQLTGGTADTYHAGSSTTNNTFNPDSGLIHYLPIVAGTVLFKYPLVTERYNITTTTTIYGNAQTTSGGGVLGAGTAAVGMTIFARRVR